MDPFRLVLSVLGKRFGDKVSMLCLDGVDFFRKDDDLVFPYRILPVLALEDENRLVTTAVVNGDEDVDLVVDTSCINDLPPLNEERLLAQSWARS